ncbi:MAG: hypothetical protein E7384_05775 [Ruminococcaceae bacterium]|nr:hypothetical protein [Oscillospiraceae bacterium]
MKKIVTLILVLIMALSMTVLSGCGDDKSTESKKPAPTVEPSSSATVSATTESATQKPATTTSAETTATTNVPATTAPVMTTATENPSPSATQKPSTPKPTATTVVKTDAELIIGKWETIIDFGLATKKIYESNPQTMAYAEFVDSLMLKNYYEFNPDGSYTDYFEDDYKSKLEVFYANIYKKILVADAEANNISVEQALSLRGYTKMENYIADLLVAADIENNFPKMTQGTYTIANKKLTCSYEFCGEKITETLSYTLTSSKLTVTDIDSDVSDVVDSIIYNKIS